MADVITSFNKDIVNRVTDDFVEELQELAERHGLTVDRGNGTYGNKTCTMKLKVGVADEDGTPVSFEGWKFNERASLYGVKPEALGTVVENKGKKLTLSGINPRAKKKHFILRDSDGGRYTATTDQLRRLADEDIFIN